MSVNYTLRCKICVYEQNGICKKHNRRTYDDAFCDDFLRKEPFEEWCKEDTKVNNEAIPSAYYKGITNGEVFLTVHPNVVAEIIKKKDNIFDVVQLRHKGDTLPFAEIYIDWWNSPYSEEQLKKRL